MSNAASHTAPTPDCEAIRLTDIDDRTLVVFRVTGTYPTLFVTISSPSGDSCADLIPHNGTFCAYTQRTKQFRRFASLDEIERTLPAFAGTNLTELAQELLVA